MTTEEFEYRMWEAEGLLAVAKERWAEGEQYEAEADIAEAAASLSHFAAAIDAPPPLDAWSGSETAPAPF